MNFCVVLFSFSSPGISDRHSVKFCHGRSQTSLGFSVLVFGWFEVRFGEFGSFTAWIPGWFFNDEDEMIQLSHWKALRIVKIIVAGMHSRRVGRRFLPKL